MRWAALPGCWNRNHSSASYPRPQRRLPGKSFRLLHSALCAFALLVLAGTTPAFALLGTTTTVISSANPSGLSQSVTFTATVTGLIVQPGGTVTFKDGATVLGTGTIDASAHAIFTSSSLLTGLLPITAVFAGDTNCAGSTSSILNLTVNLGLASASVTSSQNPSSYNQSVTFTATVSGVVLLTPTGTVTFKDGATTLGTGTLNGSGVTTLSTSALAVGSHSITVVYGGDTLYGTATSSTLTQTVNKATTTSAVVSSVNPTSYGGSTTFTATVSSTAGTPTGTVTFRDGATTIGTGTLNGSGVATLATGALLAGSHSITVVYGGDTNFATSTSSAITQTVNKNATTTALVSGTNPAAYGASVTFTATVSGINGPPTGTVTFKDGAATIGTGTLDGSGVATFATAALAAGTHTITAVYGGDANFTTSTSSSVSQVTNQNATATALVSGTNPSTFGQSVTFTATVSGTNGPPTGTVTFKDGAATIGTGTLNGSGVATFTTTALIGGSHTITAVYGGDTNFTASTSSTVTQVVNNGTSTTALSASPNPSALGQNVVFTATVSGPGAAPSGTVTFKDGATTLGTGTLNGSGVATLSTGALAAGSHTITAVYGGDSNYNTSTSAPLTQVVNQSTTTTALVSSVNPSSFGQSTTFTATVSGTGGTATGTVTFKDGATTLGTGTLDGFGQTTLSTSALAVGSHSITAVYGGDSNFITSTSPVLTQSVGMNASTTALTSSANPSAYNQSVTFTATVTGSGGTPGGTVTFKDGATTLGTGTLDGSGVATFTTSALSPGSHAITAAYGGNTNFSASTSTTLTQSVTIGTSTTTLTASPNPSALSQSITFTATVTGAGATPTGTVVFKDGGAVIGSAPLNGSGQAALPYGALGAGTHTITAEYGGDTNYAASTSAPFSQTVSQGNSATAVTASANPSAFGQSVTFTASVSGTGATATGTVTFKDGAATLGTGTLAGGQATFATAALSVGSHAITAVYGGDSNFTTSTSPTLTQNVTTTTSATALASSANPSAAGDSVTFTATVTGTGGTPSGTVTFKDGATTLGTGTLSGGQATYTTSALTAGGHSITAVYGGDASYNTSTSSALTQNVNANASTTTIISSLNPSAFGQSVIYTATVLGSAGTPTGTVTFKDGGTILGTAPVNGAGQAIFTASALAGGSHTITALYGGNPAYGSSVSAPLTQTINPGAPGVTLTPSVNPSASGQPVIFTAAVTGVGGTPTGLVTFKDGPITLGTGTLDGLGRATYTANSLSTGSHSMRAFYAGDSNFAAASSPIVTQTVNAFASTATLTSSLNPSSVGQLVTFTARVSSTGGTPSGTVIFKEGGTTLATGTLNGAGIATFATSALALGSHAITAAYGGDTQFAATTSATLNQAVGIPLDSLRLRAFQVLATKMEAQTSGQATAGAIESAVAEGFADDGEILRPSELGLRMNFSADPRETIRTDELNTGAFSDILKKEDATGAIPQRVPAQRFMKEWLVWADIRNTGWLTSPEHADTKGTQLNTLAGITYRMTQDFLVGLVGGVETFNYTSQSLNARLYGTGASVGAYAGWRLRSGIRVEASLSHASIDYNASAGSANASFPAARWLFTAGITGTEKMRGFELEPSLRVYYLAETEKGYTDSLGTAQTDRSFSTGRFSAGVKAAYPLPSNDGTKVAPYVGLYADYYFTRDDATASASPAAIAGINNEMLKGWSARVASGIGVNTLGGISASLGGEFGGIGSSGNFNAWSVRGRTAIPF